MVKVTLSIPGQPTITNRYGLYGLYSFGSSSSSYTGDSTCASFSKSNVSIDAPISVGRVFGILGFIFAFVGGLYLLLAPLPSRMRFFPRCVPSTTKKRWTLFALLFPACVVVLEGMTFFVYKSDLCRFPSDDDGAVWTCGWSDGSSERVTAIGLYILTGIVMLVLGAPDTEQWNFITNETQTVTYQRQTQEDGTIVVVQTNVEKQLPIRATNEK